MLLGSRSKESTNWDPNPGLVGLTCSRTPPRLPLPLEGTWWPFPLLWNRCSHSNSSLPPSQTSFSSRRPASHRVPFSPRLLVLSSASTSSCSARPQSSCPSDGFQAAPPFLCSRLCLGTHPPNSSPRQYPHHIQSTQTFTPRTRTIHPSNSTIFHRCEPSVLGQQALTQCKTLSSIT